MLSIQGSLNLDLFGIMTDPGTNTGTEYGIFY